MVSWWTARFTQPQMHHLVDACEQWLICLPRPMRSRVTDRWKMRSSAMRHHLKVGAQAVCPD